MNTDGIYNTPGMLPIDFMNRKISLKTCLQCVAFIMSFTCLLVSTSPSIAEVSENAPISEETRKEDERVREALKDLLASMDLKPFTYQTEGRPDPFLSFISVKVAQEAETSSETLTGMRQFEPGQLTLVSIIFTEGNAMAMVEDSSHKGYIVRKGTKIGRSGIISNISPNQVIIKQLSYSTSTRKSYKTVEMTLRKEGGM